MISRGRLNRMKNIGKSKDIDEHINHFLQRMKERYNKNYNINDYKKIIDMIIKSEGKTCHFLYKINWNNKVFSINYDNITFNVLFGNTSNKVGLDARLKTVLFPTRFMSPNNLILKGIDDETFTNEIYKTIDEIEFLKSSFPIEYKELFTSKKYSHIDIPIKSITKLSYEKNLNPLIHQGTYDYTINKLLKK